MCGFKVKEFDPLQKEFIFDPILISRYTRFLRDFLETAEKHYMVRMCNEPE